MLANSSNPWENQNKKEWVACFFTTSEETNWVAQIVVGSMLLVGGAHLTQLLEQYLILEPAFHAQFPNSLYLIPCGKYLSVYW